MRKLAAGLLVLAVLLSAAFMAHATVTGVVVPYQDPTPEQVAYERYHRAISEPLFFAAGLAWMAAGVAVVVCTGCRLWRVRRG